jgi:hypothetical protein
MRASGSTRQTPDSHTARAQATSAPTQSSSRPHSAGAQAAIASVPPQVGSTQRPATHVVFEGASPVPGQTTSAQFRVITTVSA